MSKLSLTNHRLRLTVLSGLLAVMFGLSARAVPYQYVFNSDTGLVPAGGNLTFEHLVNAPPSSIETVEIILNFAASDLLNGVISGSLTLSTAPSSPGPYVTFSPLATYPGTVYDATFTSPFLGLSPNGYWDLNLVDSDPVFENKLLGWTLDITTAPRSVPDGVNTLLLLSLGLPALALLKRRRASAAMA